MLRNFSQRKLATVRDGRLPPSMPLVIPNDYRYDAPSNDLIPIAGETRKSLKIVPETLQLIESIDGPVSVLAICGPCRTGKSYMLSRVLGSADDFALGHTMDAKTFGIWIGTTVLDCDDFTLLLMDTEGIDAVSATMKDDASILVMTALLSSCLIYNSIGVPNHSDLEKMSHFAQLATSIVVKDASRKSGDEDDSIELKSHFPDFIWLLRDVILLPTGDNGKQVSPTEYLMTKVFRRSKSFKESESDQVGRAILTVFPTINCKTVRPPSTEPTVMRDIASKQDSLDPKFNKEIQELVQYVLQVVRGKRGLQSGKMVDGPILATMAEHYLEAVNDPDAIPCISNTWQTAITMRCEKVLEQLLQEYDHDMRKKIAEVGEPMEEDSTNDAYSTKPTTLFALHRSTLLEKTTSLLKQVGHFITSSVKTGGVLNKESLIAELELKTATFAEEQTGQELQGIPIIRKRVTGGLLLKFVQDNYKASRSSCINLFEKLYKSIEEKMTTDHGNYSFDDLMMDLKTLEVNYNKGAVGPAKWEVYDEKRDFIKTQESSYKVLQGFKKKAFDAQQKAADANSKAAQMQNSIQQLQAQMKNDAEMNRQRIQQLEKHHHDEMEKFKIEEKERMENDQRRFENFTKAQMEMMADMVKESSEQSKTNSTMMMNCMEQMMKDNRHNIEQLTKAIEQLSIPPPASDTGSTLGGILDVVMTFAPLIGALL